ncbi:MAG: rhodanese [Planctomycetaceae bacterium]|nr:rhodanese [Planctomycetaceae bacterium]
MTKRTTIEPTTVQQWHLENRDFVLLDCREQNEFDYAHLPGCRLFPMSEIGSRLTELSEFRNRTIVVYCHHGVRSLRVANWLSSNGFTDVYNMAGGIDRWSLEVDPQTPRY